MSPRGRTAGRWADRAYLEIEVDADMDTAEEYYTGRVVFPRLPLGDRDHIDLTVGTAIDNLGRLAITSLEMNKPINHLRLRALPLEAIRARCEQLFKQGDRKTRQTLTAHLGLQDPLEEVSELLSIAAANKRSGDEFWEAVAAVVRVARENGKSGWTAVWHAIGTKVISESTAHRYVAKAKAAGFDLGEALLSADEFQPIPLEKIHNTKEKKK